MEWGFAIIIALLTVLAAEGYEAIITLRHICDELRGVNERTAAE